MTLGAPTALWWSLIALPIIGLFFFRHRPAVREVPSIMFWEQIEKSRRVSWIGDRFSRWITLLAQLVIAAVLVGALTDPNPARPAGHLVIVLDDSATMQTLEEEDQTRFDMARAMAAGHVRAATPGIPITVVLAGQAPTVAINRESNHEKVKSALAGLRARDVNPQLDAGVQLARALAQDDRSSHVVVFTDTRTENTEGGPPVEWRHVGRPHPNIGISALDCSDDQNAVTVVIAQTGLAGQTATVRMIARGGEVGRTELALPDRPIDVSLGAKLSEGEPFEIQVEPKDALPLDNTAFGVWPTSQKFRICLVTDGNLPLLAAVSQPVVSVELLDYNAWNGSSDADVVVLDSPPPNLPHPDRGCFMIIGGADPLGLTAPDRVRTNLSPNRWRPDHPLLSNVDLPSWRIERTSGMGPSAELQSIVESDDASLVLALREPSPTATRPAASLQAVYLNFNLSDSNLVRKIGFPVLIWNAVNFLRGSRPGQPILANPTGRPLSIPIQFDENLRLLDPNGQPCSWIAADNRLVLPQPDRAGLYEVMRAGERIALSACNWTNDGHENIQAEEKNAAAGAPSFTARISFVSPLWRFLAVSAALLILLEMWLYYHNVLRIN